MASSKRRLEIRVRVSPEVGRIYEQATGRILQPRESLVVLKKSKEGYFPVTSYLLP